jgi:CheY-like chemotaxis protein
LIGKNRVGQRGNVHGSLPLEFSVAMPDKERQACKTRAVSIPRLPQDLLVVEDEVLLQMDIEEILRRLGVPTVRCARNVAAALAAIEERTPDFALLDVGLGVETSFKVARKLHQLGVRFVFVTGHGDDQPFDGEFADTLKIRKPYTAEMVRASLASAFRPAMR